MPINFHCFVILCMSVPFPSHSLKYIDIAVNNTDPSERSATGASLNPDLLERSKVSICHILVGYCYSFFL